jgi:hypothetical protein
MRELISENPDLRSTRAMRELISEILIGGSTRAMRELISEILIGGSGWLLCARPSTISSWLADPVDNDGTERGARHAQRQEEIRRVHATELELGVDPKCVVPVFDLCFTRRVPGRGGATNHRRKSARDRLASE